MERFGKTNLVAIYEEDNLTDVTGVKIPPGLVRVLEIPGHGVVLQGEDIDNTHARWEIDVPTIEALLELGK